MKYTECNKIVKRIAFEKAISVADTKKSVVDQINLESMSTVSVYMHYLLRNIVCVLLHEMLKLIL